MGQDTSQDLGSSHHGKVTPSPTIPQLRAQSSKKPERERQTSPREEMIQPGQATSLVTKVSLGPWVPGSQGNKRAQPGCLVNGDIGLLDEGARAGR